MAYPDTTWTDQQKSLGAQYDLLIDPNGFKFLIDPSNPALVLLLDNGVGIVWGNQPKS